MKKEENKNKILIVDDEAPIRNLCVKALSKIGYGADSAESAEEALKMISENEYSVALLDIMLPKMDGMKLLSIVKEKHPNIEVMMLTGNATIKDAVEAMKMGAYDFITKPFEVHEIRKAVRKALEKEMLQREVEELKGIVSINKIAQAISRLMPLNELLKLIFTEAKKVIDADTGSVDLFDRERGEITMKYSDSGTGEDAGQTKIVENVKKHAVVHLRPQLFKGTDSDSGAVRSGMCVPMIVKKEIIGTINFNRVTNEEPFTEYDLKIAAIFAQQAANAIQNAKDWQKLKELDELKNEFLANVSHELKTPLQTITNACEILSEKMQADRLLSVLLRNTERMRGLVSQLLDFSRMQKEGFKPHLQFGDIGTLLKESIEELGTQAGKKNIRLESDIADLPDIQLEKDAIKRVALNLIDNALKCCPEGSVVHVSAYQSHEEVRVSIKDNGPGIPYSNQKYIFDRFYQKEPGKSFTDKPAGLGLGLAMVREIIKGHKGRIWLESVPGEGAAFIFALPTNWL